MFILIIVHVETYIYGHLPGLNSSQDNVIGVTPHLLEVHTIITIIDLNPE